MTDMPTIAVRGEATIEVDAETAEFTATVELQDRDRVSALNRVAERVAALRAVLDRFSNAIERHETSSLAVNAAMHDPGKNAEILRYHGNATTNVVVGDLDVVGDMMLAIASLDEIGVWGPSWSVRPASPVHRTARHAAISDAITRARDYAAALGADIVGLVELSDAGVTSGRQNLTMMRSAAANQAGPPHLDLDPKRQRIHASIEARFTISEPTILAAPLD
jgi:uncharacterized protein YggE